MGISLSKSDVVEVTGIKGKTFDNWCSGGILIGDGEGRGQGHHRRFTPIQVLGIAVGVVLQKSDRGCPPRYVKKIVESFELLGGNRLEKLLNAGKTHFMQIGTDGLPVLDTPPNFPEYPDINPDDHWPNVSTILQQVVSGMATIQLRFQDRRCGHPRGLG